MTVISTQIVDVDDIVTGHLWSVDDFDGLAKLIAIIAIGQAEHASEIINELSVSLPVPSRLNFYDQAREQLKIRGKSKKEKEVSGYHRDGFLFECMSWIVARQTAGENTYLKDPHISATTQGLDGLIIQIDPEEKIVTSTTISEDKCTEYPRDKFRDGVMQTFIEHHQNIRGPDLLANAALLIKQSGLKGTAAILAAEKVYDISYRTYRAALTVGKDFYAVDKRKKLFKGYDGLTDIQQDQRVGAIFIVPGDLRVWFQELADHVIEALNEFEQKEATNV